MIRKAEQFLFYLLLFSIPFQTRKILWQQEWYFNEWQSVSIYATDILLALLFVFWAFNYFQTRKFSIFNFQFSNKFQNLKSQIKKPDFYLIIFVIVSIISVKNSSSYVLSAWSVLKLIEFVLFYFYLKNHALPKFNFVHGLTALILGGVFQSVVAILQFLKQSDLGLRVLGESLLSLDMNGIASFYNFYGEKVIRSYGTTPHPNVLAAYLFLAIFAFYFLLLYKNIHRYYLFFYGLTFLAFFFTFARVMIFLLFLNFLVRAILVRLKFKKEYWNRKLALILFVTLSVVVIFNTFYWPEVVSRIKISPDEEAVQLRIFYNKESLSSLNWFGVGSGNFVNWLMAENPNLPRNLYQPVHNIYLLILSETGILGLAAFILFLIFLVKNFISRTRLNKLYHYSFLLVFLSVLFIGLFDHFLLTLQQGGFVFWLVCACLTLFKSSDIIVK